MQIFATLWSNNEIILTTNRCSLRLLNSRRSRLFILLTLCGQFPVLNKFGITKIYNLMNVCNISRCFY